MTALNRTWTAILALLLAGACTDGRLAGTALADNHSGDRGRDVPYVPTPHRTVDQMLKMAAVGTDDVLYDLGSGDGRIVIAAARTYGTRGVGIDIDPKRIEEANVNAHEAGVTDRVEFIEGDLFEADLREATAVTLYLLPSVNLRLRPKLLEELRPGTPVVSHDFHMGEWEPDDFQDVGGDRLYLWIIPAQVAGVWRWSDTQGGDHVLTLNQKFQQISGQLQRGDASIPLSELGLRGDRISFTAHESHDGRPVARRYSGRVDGGVIRGETQLAGSPAQPWSARHER
jgi:hypothetical protein